MSVSCPSLTSRLGLLPAGAAEAYGLDGDPAAAIGPFPGNLRQCPAGQPPQVPLFNWMFLYFILPGSICC